MFCLQVDFKLARPGLMKDFAGKWTVQPFTQSTLDGLYNQEQQPVRLAPWHSLTKSLTKGAICLSQVASSRLCYGLFC